MEKVLKDITKDPEEEKKKGGKKDDLLKPAEDGPKKAVRTKEIDNQGIYWIYAILYTIE